MSLFLDAGGGDLDVFMATLWLEGSAWAGLHGARWPTREFVAASIGKGPRNHRGYPYFADVFKAACVPTILRFLHAYCLERPALTREAQWRSAALWGVNKVLSIMHTSPQFSLPERAMRTQHAGRVFAVAYQALASAALLADLPLWKARPKLHNLCHQFDELASVPQNLLHTACFGEKGFMGACKRLGARCHRSTVGRRVLTRYAMYLAVRLSNAGPRSAAAAVD